MKTRGETGAHDERKNTTARRLAITLMVAVMGAGLAPGSAHAAAGATMCADAQSTVDDVGMARAKAATLCLLKAERVARGLQQVRPDAGLAAVARRQATAMVDQGYFAHVGPDHKQLRERLQDAGWLPRYGSWSAGEILAEGTGALGTPDAIVDAWLNSPEHLAILRDPTFDRIGVGLAAGTPDGDGDGVTAAVEFGRRTVR